jgi:zinc/manganese transport system substrate-binding protein/manganese/iron transport system substrate-binding protein
VKPLRATVGVLLLAALAASLSACAEEEAAGGALPVVATTTQLVDLVRNVGGDRVDVRALLRPDVDPHDYEPTPGDVEAVADARVVIANGVGLDDWVARVVDAAGGDAEVVEATRGIALRPGDGEHPDGDPHVWMDPDRAAVMVGTIRDALSAADPSGAGAYAAAATEYTGRIRALDARLKRLVATVPPADRELVTNHDAFGYLAEHYGIRVVGAVIPSLSTGAEPDARAIADLVATIRREKVRTIFTEESLDPGLEREIAREAGVRVEAGLFADTLGPEDGPAGTYLGMMETNVRRMVAGFRGR